MLKNIFQLLRPHQYIKNTFLFFPLFFVGEMNNITLVVHTFIAFIAFSLSASAIYILNDYHDIEEDRQHPKKKYRPLVSGAISKKKALLIMFLLGSLGISLLFFLSKQAVLYLLAYIALNICYSFYLKHIAIIDISIIAIGFVLRLFVGSAVTNTPLSQWIVIMTFLLALFLALAKRRDDVLLFLSTGKKMRKVIDGYNLPFLDGAMNIMASLVIVVYILYTTSREVTTRFQTETLYFTAFFVIIGIMRYMQIAYIEKNTGSPTRVILRDTFIKLTILGWVLSFTWIIYL